MPTLRPRLVSPQGDASAEVPEMRVAVLGQATAESEGEVKSESKKVPRSKWTAEELEFNRLVNMADSRDQVTRIDGRFRLQRFVDLHGKEKCDAMWARIK